MKKYILPFTLALSAALYSTTVCAGDDNFVLTIKDHQFAPANLTLPSGKKIKLTVKNEQTVPAEFESSDLDREKVVNPNSEIIVFLGPLDAGSYGYFDDFHRETTGTIVVK